MLFLNYSPGAEWIRTRENSKARCTTIDQNWEYVYIFSTTCPVHYSHFSSSVFSPFFNFCHLYCFSLWSLSFSFLFFLVEKSRNGEFVRFNIFVIFWSLAVFLCLIFWLAGNCTASWKFLAFVFLKFYFCKWIDLNRYNWFKVQFQLLF